MRSIAKALNTVYQTLLTTYGEQSAWWPGDSPFEIMVGAILTQNTAWTNAVKAISSLKQSGMLSAGGISDLPVALLAQKIRSSGYYKLKAERLLSYIHWYIAMGEYEALRYWPTSRLRAALLSIRGIGPETADDILLYAFKRPVFIIDAYTRRLGARLNWMEEHSHYEHWQQLFETLPPEVSLYAEYHALIITHAKVRCHKSKPICEDCKLRSVCAYNDSQSY